jgi:hypothetical protein
VNNDVQNVPVNNEVQNVPVNNEVQNIPVNVDVQNVPVNNEVQNVPVNNEVQNVPVNDPLNDYINTFLKPLDDYNLTQSEVCCIKNFLTIKFNDETDNKLVANIRNMATDKNMSDHIRFIIDHNVDERIQLHLDGILNKIKKTRSLKSPMGHEPVPRQVINPEPRQINRPEPRQINRPVPRQINRSEPRQINRSEPRQINRSEPRQPVVQEHLKNDAHPSVSVRPNTQIKPDNYRNVNKSKLPFLGFMNK